MTRNATHRDVISRGFNETRIRESTTLVYVYYHVLTSCPVLFLASSRLSHLKLDPEAVPITIHDPRSIVSLKVRHRAVDPQSRPSKAVTKTQDLGVCESSGSGFHELRVNTGELGS